MRSLYFAAAAATLITAPAFAQASAPSAQAKHRNIETHKAHKRAAAVGASVNTSGSPMANAGNGAENPAGASSNSGGGLTSSGGNAGGHLSDDR
jgi:hypothetical protein